MDRKLAIRTFILSASGFLILTVGFWVLAQQQPPVKNSYVQPNVPVGKKSDGTFIFLQTDPNGSLYITTTSPGLVAQGQAAPPKNSYVQPYAPVAIDTNGAWHYLQVDSNGNVYTTTAGDASGVNINGNPITDPNFNATTPAADSSFIACTFKITGSNVVLECPTGTTSSTFLVGNGNAATATALASAPTLCSAGSYTLGVNTVGNAQSCTSVTGGLTAASSTGALALPVQVGYTRALSQTSSIGATTLFATGGNDALYRASIDVDCSSTASGETLTPSIRYTDTSGTVQTLNATAAVCTSLGSASISNATLSFQAKASTNIQYLVTTGIGTTATWNVRVGIEQLSTQ